MSVVEIKNICFKYKNSGNFALEEISLNVNEGEFIAVMGRNGSGKTAFCRLFNGTIPHLIEGHLIGNIIIDGIDTVDSSVTKLAEKVGIVFDDPDTQLFTSTVRHEAAFGPENLLLPPEEINERVRNALYAVGLSGFEERVPSTLSGGEKQRLAIAAALAMKSKILVLDEPLCRLDPDGADEVLAVLNEIKKNYRMTVIMASHNTGKMAQYADRVCVLNNGRIAALDTAEKILADNDLLEQNGIQPINKIKKFTANHTNDTNLSCNLNSDVRDGSSGSWLKKPVIQISNFSYNYKSSDVKIKNINLTIFENDFTVFIGSNGCGKTTLLKNITGLLRPSSGEILIRGRNVNDMKICDVSKEIGFVMQNPDTQLFTDTVFKEVSFALKNMRLPKEQIKQRAQEALRIVGLDDYDAFPHALSRADRAKLVIACVLAMGCKIIIMDEIDAGLDFNDCKKIMNIARDLNSKGFTIIFVTHNMFLACEYSRRIIKMARNGIEEI